MDLPQEVEAAQDVTLAREESLHRSELEARHYGLEMASAALVETLAQG